MTKTTKVGLISGASALVLGLVIGTVGAHVSVVHAAEGGCLGFGGRARMIKRLGRLRELHEKLDISSEQIDAAHGLKDRYLERAEPVARRIVAARRAFRDAVLAESPDEQLIRATAAELGAAIGDAGVLGTDVVADLRVILDEEQRSLIAEAIAEHDTFVDGHINEVFGAEADANE